MSKAKLVALAAAQKARALDKPSKTFVAVFKEKKARKARRTTMMTTKNIVKEPEKAEVTAPKATLHDEPQTLPAPPPPKPESDYQKAYRMLKDSRERLRGRGMPELDVEIENFLKTINSWEHRQN